jgi:predicted Zn-dependent protease
VTREQARSLTRRILAFAAVPEIAVELEAGRRAYLRFARNAPSTSGVSEDLTVKVTAWRGKRKASVAANAAPEASESALRRLVAEAEARAALSPEDPEYVPLLGPQTYLDVRAFDRETAELSPSARAKAAGDAIAQVKSRNLIAAGIIRNSAVYYALANSAGLFAYFPVTRVSFSITARTADGAASGYAAAGSVSFRSVDCKEAAAIAAKKALDSRGARELPPGSYSVILEPQALADLSPSLVYALNARQADEGRSVFSAPGGKIKIGERIFDPRVNIYTDPQHPVVPGSIYGEDGYPTARSYLARAGVLENLSNSRFWAGQKGRRPGPFVVNLIMDGEGKSVAEMIASTDRGLLLSRLWYVRPVDPQQALVTGLTRDGSFYIENGKIVHAVKNFRFNESLVRLLGEVEMLGVPQRVFSSENVNYGDGGMPMLLPAIKVKSFRFTSISDAV